MPAEDAGPEIIVPPDLGIPEVQDGEAPPDDIPRCPEPLLECGGLCFDAQTDPMHCGSCAPCEVIQGASASCAQGQCVYTCGEGFSDDDNDLHLGPTGTGCECPGGPDCEGDCTENACGGCGPLPAQPGGSCGECGTWRCERQRLECEDRGTNACGGCGPLSQQPGEACGVCGTLVCDNLSLICMEQSDPTLGCPIFHTTFDSVHAVINPTRGFGSGEMKAGMEGNFEQTAEGGALDFRRNDWVRYPQADFRGNANINLQRGVIDMWVRPREDNQLQHLLRVSVTSRVELRIDLGLDLEAELYDTLMNRSVSQVTAFPGIDGGRWVRLTLSYDIGALGERPWAIWFVNGYSEATLRMQNPVSAEGPSPNRHIYLGAFHEFDNEGTNGLIGDVRIYGTPVH